MKTHMLAQINCLRQQQLLYIRYMFLWVAMLLSGCVVVSIASASEPSDDANAIVALSHAGVNVAGLPVGAAKTTTQQHTQAPANHPPSVESPASLGLQQLPALNAPVVDVAGLLTPNDQAQLAAKIQAIAQARLAQIGVIIIPTTGVEPVFDYATRAFSAWQLGDAARDNGILVVVAANDHKLQILTGYGVEGVLPDVLLKHIINQTITPLFKTQQYAAGLNAGVDQINQYLQADPETTQANQRAIAQATTAATESQHSMNQGVFLMIALLVAAPFVRAIFGRFVSATGLGIAGGAIAALGGASLFASLLFGFAAFVLLLIGVGNLIGGMIQGGGGFGGGSGGGYSGGGGSFGGGGASGSW